MYITAIAHASAALPVQHLRPGNRHLQCPGSSRGTRNVVCCNAAPYSHIAGGQPLQLYVPPPSGEQHLDSADIDDAISHTAAASLLSCCRRHRRCRNKHPFRLISFSGHPPAPLRQTQAHQETICPLPQTIPFIIGGRNSGIRTRRGNATI